MQILKKYAVFLIVSIITGGMITSYFEEYQRSKLVPIRNLIVLGTWQSHSEDLIPVSRYRSGEGVNPVHVAETTRSTALRVLEAPSAPVVISPIEARKLLDIADYFVETAQERRYCDSIFYVWTYDFDYPIYKLRALWISGMAQGHVIEVMLAAHAITGDENYLETARLAANAMAVPIEYGGVAIDLGEGLWFEEYAQPGVTPPRVLNGHNFALSGLYYLSLVDGDYRRLFDLGVLGLESLLPEFDKQIWSMYDLQGIPANRKYQRIHVMQLRELYNLTRRETLLFYEKRFSVQLYFPFSAFYRVITYPNTFLVVILGGNILVVFICEVTGSLVFQKLRRSRRCGLKSAFGTSKVGGKD